MLLPDPDGPMMAWNVPGVDSHVDPGQGVNQRRSQRKGLRRPVVAINAAG